MRFFTCVLDPEGRGITDRMRRGYEALPRERGLEFQWQSYANAAVLTGWDDPYGEPMVVEDGDWIAAGIVRLDNRQELERWVHHGERIVTDLGFVLRMVAHYGTQYISKLLGDFAFVAWNGRTRSGVGTCDAFAVQKLYYAERAGFVAFASRAELLAFQREYNVAYLADMVSLQDCRRDTTVYAGVRAVPPASMAVLDRSHIAIQRYWDASDFTVEPSWLRAEQETIDTCRRLLVDSIRQRVGANGNTWAQLSGGLDSSSIVSLAQWLAERGEIAHGLAGTVTFVDHCGTGTDERMYSDAIVARWLVRNEAIVEPPTWYDEHHAPPRTDQPRGDLHVYPRDSRLCAVVHGAGGRVLLSGSGGDELFTGNMLFFADWVAQGRIWAAVREMARRAATGRVSFWKLAYRNALLPLLPRTTHARLVHDQHETPAISWIERSAMQRYGLTAQSYSAPAYGGKVRQKYHHAVVSTIGRLQAPHHGGVIADSLDVRHPFLYRPLVEFALRLPPELRARPHAHRWVLREAMRGILPDKVRTRVGKPGTADFLSWSLSKQQARLAPLTREPILGELGVIHPAKLREAFNTALHDTRYGAQMHGPLFTTLAVEAWLQIRSDRWPSSSHVGS